MKVVVYNMDMRCNENITKAVEIARLLLQLADEGDESREDIGCGVLFGTMRDSAYKIKALAEAELAEHKRMRRWRGRDARVETGRD